MTSYKTPPIDFSAGLVPPLTQDFRIEKFGCKYHLITMQVKLSQFAKTVVNSGAEKWVSTFTHATFGVCMVYLGDVTKVKKPVAGSFNIDPIVGDDGRPNNNFWGLNGAEAAAIAKVAAIFGKGRAQAEGEDEDEEEEVEVVKPKKKAAKSKLRQPNSVAP